MAEIISLADKKQEKSPHITGEARCRECGHEWTAVAPLGARWLECPECHTVKGLFKYPCDRKDDEHWTCKCGMDVFTVYRNGIMCPICGEWQNGF
jgi:hypothetical protein